MTSPIRRLPEHLINKIAAGEVVERPASALKELLENALDAEATAIAVDLRDGGSALIRVTDDGTGMTADDLTLALERHATSKLGRDEDLDAIATLGFRGEALPAICAVSRFVITTCPRDAPEGTRVGGAGGRIEQRLSVAVDGGTTVEVSDLFYNTPARLKFLKAVATEVAACLRAGSQLAIAHPAVAFRVTSNGRRSLTAPRAGDLGTRLGALWGFDVAGRLLDVARAEHGVTVRGLLSPPDLTRGHRDDVTIIVNGRPVRDPGLFHTVLEAYRPLLARDRFPLVALVVELPFADVDVNVHPTKALVRFRHPRLVHEIVGAAVSEALRQRAVVPSVALGAPAEHAPPRVSSETGQEMLFEEARAPYAAPGLGRVLGQVQDTFIVCTSDEEVFFVDQHAAHERVLFERFQADLAGGRPVSQTLLFAEPVELAPAARALLERWREPLEHLGFAFEGFGGHAITMRAVPALLVRDEPRRLVESAVDELGALKPGEPVLDRMLAFVACRGAIKANLPLDREEMEHLVADLGETRSPYFCPHGRPTMSRISLLDIRREVKRVWQ